MNKFIESIRKLNSARTQGKIRIDTVVTEGNYPRLTEDVYIEDEDGNGDTHMFTVADGLKRFETIPTADCKFYASATTMAKVLLAIDENFDSIPTNPRNKREEAYLDGWNACLEQLKQIIEENSND